MLEMLLGRSPWVKENGEAMSTDEQIASLKQKSPFKLPKGLLSDKMLSILNMCLRMEPRKRDSIDCILKQINCAVTNSSFFRSFLNENSSGSS